MFTIHYLVISKEKHMPIHRSRCMGSCIHGALAITTSGQEGKVISSMILKVNSQHACNIMHIAYHALLASPSVMDHFN